MTTDGDIEFAVDESNLDSLARVIHNINVEHGFWEADRNFGEVIALIHSELSEALEEHRSGKDLYYEENGKPEGVAVELVDAMVRILDWLGANSKMFIGEILEKKMKYNNGRPYKHGRNY